MKRNFALVMITMLLTMCLAGCGETVNGLSKDLKRVGKGIRTVFVRDN